MGIGIFPQSKKLPGFARKTGYAGEFLYRAGYFAPGDNADCKENSRKGKEYQPLGCPYND